MGLFKNLFKQKTPEEKIGKLLEENLAAVKEDIALSRKLLYSHEASMKLLNNRIVFYEKALNLLQEAQVPQIKAEPSKTEPAKKKTEKKEEKLPLI